MSEHAGERGSSACDTFAASQFAYLYYALKVCTLFVRKKYILLSV